ncbi:hypothetical protein JHK87_049803 [Glycine soja]|nr:hypothetical protein JHK87_049803 [Glycine soja]
MSQRGSLIPTHIQPDIHGLGARVNTKGSNAESVLNPCLPNDVAPVEPLMGFAFKTLETKSEGKFVNETAKNFGDEKQNPSGEDDVAADGNKENPTNEAEQKEPENKVLESMGSLQSLSRQEIASSQLLVNYDSI